MQNRNSTHRIYFSTGIFTFICLTLITIHAVTGCTRTCISTRGQFRAMLGINVMPQICLLSSSVGAVRTGEWPLSGVSSEVTYHHTSQ